MDTSSYNVRFDEENKILIIEKSGMLSKELIVELWRDLVNSGKIPEGTKRFLFDHTNSNFEKTSEVKDTLALFFSQYASMLKDSSIAIVHNSSSIAVAVILTNINAENINFKSFIGYEAAIKWLRESAT